MFGTPIVVSLGDSVTHKLSVSSCIRPAQKVKCHLTSLIILLGDGVEKFTATIPQNPKFCVNEKKTLQNLTILIEICVQ